MLKKGDYLYPFRAAARHHLMLSRSRPPDRSGIGQDRTFDGLLKNPKEQWE